MSKDWLRAKQSVFITLGASNHASEEREVNDYYATDPIAIDKLKEVFDIPKNIYECACGEGHLSERLKELGHNVYSTDLIDRGYGDEVGVDFLKLETMPKGKENYSILTNPPYKFAKDFVLKGLDLVQDGNYVIMFLRILFLESKARKQELFDVYPPKYVFVSSERILCAKNADFERMRKNGGSAIAYAWYVWQKGYKGETILKWI